MKKQVQAFIASLGGSSSYAGNTKNGNVKTLFINDPKSADRCEDIPGNEGIEAAVLNQFGFNLPFTLKTN